jgi:sugar lactone lactonase YvrE
MDLVVDGLAFPECPRWHDGRLWFSDMAAGEVLSVEPGDTAVVEAEVPAGPGGLGWTPTGELLVVSMGDRTLLRRERGGALVEVADLSAHEPVRCNDMVVDAEGRAYIGTFGYDLFTGAPPAPGRLLRVDPDGAVHVLADDLVFPNGMAITADGGELLVAETFALRITAFALTGDGAVGARRTFARCPDGARPDGICLDADGGVWVASPGARAVLRFDRDGAVTERLPVPDGDAAYACMLGDAGGRSLFVCTAPGPDPDRARRERAGRIHVTGVGVAHAGRP